jgi:UDP-N-acetylmuramate--alanine ligase
MYKKNLHIHFVGIGGIGMSGIATILKRQGYTISGCDPDTKQDTIAPLEKIGCKVYHGNNSSECDDATIDIVVYIPMYATTIPAVTAEIERARSRGIITISRAGMLAELMRSKYSIAISGSHGKTTTTSLISHILIEADTDPTVVIGGQLKNINSNIRLGSGNFLVAEADESDRSFLQLFPTLAIVTNIDLEHLETYKDLDDIKQAFMQFMNNLPFYGKAIVCNDDENIRSLSISHVKTLTYGIEYAADFYARDIILNTDHSLFTVYTKKNNAPLGNIIVPLPGKHNVYNCLAAIALAHELEISFERIAQSIQTFGGVERRFSFRGFYKGAEVFDDYGHHPKEIENTLLVARKRAKNKLIVVFQPHRYTRTQKLWTQFLETFYTSIIDTLIITDIHSAGEQPIDKINSKTLTDHIQSLNPHFSVHYIPSNNDFTHIKEAITRFVQPNDLILFLGAGKVYHIAQDIVKTPI